MSGLSLIFGVIVGLSLGLTGGGGAIFAVPMLVYGLGSTTREAVGISLASVGVTSCVGFLGRWRSGQVEIRTGLLFAIAGMVGAPIGSWLAGLMPEPLLLTLFAILMLVVAYRMWSKAVASTQAAIAACPVENPDEDGPSCQRDAEGNLRLTSRCARLLLLVGLLTGVLSGLFGVGGGFVIVPALILFSGMAIHRAVGTSLLVITLVSVSGVASHLYAGRTIPLEVTLWFIAGGIGGMLLGSQIGRHLSGPTLQKGFALAILAVATFVFYRTFFLK
ncbi:MAG: sulfite exporter TauE/SafE family protein [Planctomycetota bacterium]|nr:MAG: sulfite exporter TauE/SafE family protein [Planctomycetota bacterium]